VKPNEVKIFQENVKSKEANSKDEEEEEQQKSFPSTITYIPNRGQTY